ASLDDPAGDGRSDHRRAQRQGAYPGAGQREHGRPQARRVRPHPYLQGSRRRQEGRQVRSMTMEAKAILRTARISPQKARLVADQVGGMPASRAHELPKFSAKKPAHRNANVLWSAISYAENNLGADIDALEVSTIMADEGPLLKRFTARAKGRGTRILRRTSHITVVV